MGCKFWNLYLFIILNFQENKYPWIVSILTDPDDPWTQKCGGTLVASKYVVTSASCVHETSPASIFVMLGEHNISKTEENQRIHDVLYIFPHEYFYASTKTHDIAVLELATHVNLGVFTPICLAKTSDGELTNGPMPSVWLRQGNWRWDSSWNRCYSCGQQQVFWNLWGFH